MFVLLPLQLSASFTDTEHFWTSATQFSCVVANHEVQPVGSLKNTVLPLCRVCTATSEEHTRNIHHRRCHQAAAAQASKNQWMPKCTYQGTRPNRRSQNQIYKGFNNKRPQNIAKTVIEDHSTREPKHPAPPGPQPNPSGRHSCDVLIFGNQ